MHFVFCIRHNRPVSLRGCDQRNSLCVMRIFWTTRFSFFSISLCVVSPPLLLSLLLPSLCLVSAPLIISLSLLSSAAALHMTHPHHHHRHCLNLRCLRSSASLFKQIHAYQAYGPTTRVKGSKHTRGMKRKR